MPSSGALLPASKPVDLLVRMGSNPIPGAFLPFDSYVCRGRVCFLIIYLCFLRTSTTMTMMTTAAMPAMA